VNDAIDPLLVSTSSDGSVRLGLPNILAKTKNKQKLEVHELLQILSVNETEQDADVRKDDSDVDISRRRYQEVLVQVSMDQRSSTKSADESILPCSPAIGMHVVNSFISLEASNVRHTMIAYGGALGLVRIHKV